MKVNKKNLYFINEVNFKKNHAGYKARIDIVKSISKGFESVNIVNFKLWGETKQKLVALPGFLFFLLTKLSSDDGVIIQYPYPKPFLSILRFIVKIKQLKLYYIVHDVDVFRGQGNSKEIENLNSAELLIVHNKKMSSILQSLGVKSHMKNIEIFDYMTDENDEETIEIEADNDGSKGRFKIFYCGNLKKEKSGFIYKWAAESKIIRYVYGINQQSDIDEKNIYLGAFDADIPPRINNDGISFGLVWDGDSEVTCEGKYGEYLKYNNPHKTSLYLSMGLPIVVWDRAAIADFIVDNNLGIKVDNLNNLAEKINSIDLDEYNIIKNSVDEFKVKIKDGYFSRNALSLIENYHLSNHDKGLK